MKAVIYEHERVTEILDYKGDLVTIYFGMPIAIEQDLEEPCWHLVFDLSAIWVDTIQKGD